MEIIDSLLEWIKDPDNRWILYAMAFFMLMDAWVLRRLSKRSLTIKGNNSGIAVNGDVTGDIIQTQNNSGDAAPPPPANRILAVAANLSGILGLILAAATFYLSYMH